MYPRGEIIILKLPMRPREDCEGKLCTVRQVLVLRITLI